MSVYLKQDISNKFARHCLIVDFLLIFSDFSLKSTEMTNIFYINLLLENNSQYTRSKRRRLCKSSSYRSSITNQRGLYGKISGSRYLRLLLHPKKYTKNCTKGFISPKSNFYRLEKARWVHSNPSQEVLMVPKLAEMEWRLDRFNMDTCKYIESISLAWFDRVINRLKSLRG